MNNSRYIFRGKCLYNANKDKWTYGCLSTTKEQRPYAIEHIGKRDEWVSEHIDPQTVGQCTGLKDKCGTLIFEGDIVKDVERGIFVIKWDDKIFSWQAKNVMGEDCVTYFNYFLDEISPSEIIGNIWDNPELLKGDEK